MKKRRHFIIILISAVIGMASAGHCFPVKGPEKTLEAPAYRIRRADYLPLIVICDAYDIDWKWDPASMTVDLNKENAIIRLRVDEYKVYANGAISVQERPVVLHKGAVCVPSDFLRTVFNKTFLTQPLSQPAMTAQRIRPEPVILHHRIRKIVLDAGHGGYDPGAIGRDGIKEKYIVLDITKKVKALLEEEGVDIVMTRSDDRFVSLPKRVEIANRSKADLFISIHANASRTRRLQGFEVYYLSEAIDDNARAETTAESAGHRDDLNAILWDMELTENRRNAVRLGNSILDNIDFKKRDIKNARFFVIKGTRAPAVLVEVGYITNREECAKLRSSEYRTQIANKIAKGILDYKKAFEMTQGFTD